MTDLPALGDLRLHGVPADSAVDEQAGTVRLTAGPRTDWFNDPASGSRQHSAPALLLDVDGDFSLSARVSVEFGSTFDAGVLCLHRSEEVWAKLCFEFSPQGEPMVVSVVTRGDSDDANAVVVEGTTVHLRVSRNGEAYAFHYSLDGGHWHFVRHFRLPVAAAGTQVGFLAQSPTGEACTAVFEDVALTAAPPADLRSGV
ncbi:hypothetical protein EV189_0623 [Motilibacter rhizosphaerae]|uniref:Regulation of enolase protein 1 (Concanavalin A-like superfamily) n=1 Tax=Motilibacter rhizosphaerae TaxID=598652 RepID=A0A4Q7NYB1_9ACTN|nr:DUF1349 domain-containing protein [Motilibacter rhizosphaerae]RZS91382.1 hypothetical protein EV189_0623 [Motilibacter rhizosphaerae]